MFERVGDGMFTVEFGLAVDVCGVRLGGGFVGGLAWLAGEDVVG